MMINIVVSHNEEVIVIERRCNITLEDFLNVHAVTIQHFLIVEEALKVVRKSIVSSYV
jgi:hypothetical protein